MSTLHERAPSQRWEDQPCAIEPGWTRGDVLWLLSYLEEIEGVGSHSPALEYVSGLIMADAAELSPSLSAHQELPLAS